MYEAGAGFSAVGRDALIAAGTMGLGNAAAATKAGAVVFRALQGSRVAGAAGTGLRFAGSAGGGFQTGTGISQVFHGDYRYGVHNFGSGAILAGISIGPRKAPVSSGQLGGVSAELKPYGGPGGGHHVPAKSAFRGAAGYNPNAALAVPNTEMARLSVDHGLVTAGQMRGYKDFAQTGATLTWESVEVIEIQALVRGGMQGSMAQPTVRQAIQALKDCGVRGPTRIPWGGQ